MEDEVKFQGTILVCFLLVLYPEKGFPFLFRQPIKRVQVSLLTHREISSLKKTEDGGIGEDLRNQRNYV